MQKAMRKVVSYYLPLVVPLLFLMSCSAPPLKDPSVTVVMNPSVADAQRAIKSSEMLLDVGVMRLGQQLALLPLHRRSSDDLYWLQRAKEYRQMFPRTSGIPEIDAEVARSFKLLESAPSVMKNDN